MILDTYYTKLLSKTVLQHYFITRAILKTVIVQSNSTVTHTVYTYIHKIKIMTYLPFVLNIMVKFVAIHNAF